MGARILGFGCFIGDFEVVLWMSGFARLRLGFTVRGWVFGGKGGITRVELGFSI